MTFLNVILAAEAASKGAEEASKLSIWELTLKGGWLMIPLALLLLVRI